MRLRTVTKLARLSLFFLAVVGVAGVAPIALEQFLSRATCPALGPLPACYVALAGYCLMAASVFVSTALGSALFVSGFVPVFGLALFGSSMELFGHDACPKSSGNVPLCFYSLALASSLAALFIIDRKYRRSDTT